MGCEVFATVFVGEAGFTLGCKLCDIEKGQQNVTKPKAAVALLGNFVAKKAGPQ